MRLRSPRANLNGARMALLVMGNLMIHKTRIQIKDTKVTKIGKGIARLIGMKELIEKWNPPMMSPWRTVWS